MRLCKPAGLKLFHFPINCLLFWQAFKELGRAFPSLMAPLIYERDQYMVAVMRQLAGRSVAWRFSTSHLPWLQAHLMRALVKDAVHPMQVGAAQDLADFAHIKRSALTPSVGLIHQLSAPQP